MQVIREILVNINNFENRTIKDTKSIELTPREKAEITTHAKEIIYNIESGKDSNFYGSPLTQRGKEQLLVAIQTAMEMNKQKAKVKFTPKNIKNKRAN